MRYLLPSRNKSLLSFFLLGALYVILSSRSAGVASQLNDDKTGAPGTGGATCGNCHSGGAYGTVSVNIQLFTQGTTTPVPAYTPGTTYDMRVTIQSSAGSPPAYGFQLTCLTTAGNTPVAGYSNLATNVKQKAVTTGTFNGRTYVEQNGVTANNQFNFRWTAPAAGTGSVTFYSSGNAVNNTGSTAGDNSGVNSLVVPVASSPLQLSGTTTPVNCFGASSGAINLTVSGGTTPYSYAWSDGATTEDRNNLAAGSYTVTVTGGGTATATYTITQPTTALSVNGNVTAVGCAGAASGAINITAQGGTPPYTYNWGVGITTEDRNNLTAGNYSVTVTDAASCTTTQSFSVSQPTALQVNRTISAVSCNGQSNGSIQVSVSGGTLPYSYSWNDGFTGEDRSALAAGNYSLTVTDQNGCTAAISAQVSQPAALQASANNATIPCSGGSASVTVTASGGTSPYQGSGNFTVNLPGTYTYPVTDANGCSTSATAVISSPNAPTVSGQATAASCAGACNGSIQLAVNGGTPPFSFSWSNGQTAQNVGQLCAGNYTVTTTDQSGCAVQSNYLITAPDPLNILLSGADTVCAGETSTFTANSTGGTAPYTYTWPQGGTGNSWEASAGNYSVTVTDGQNCSSSLSFSLVEEDSILISVNQVDGDNGNGSGAIDISVNGGGAPYTYAWSNGQSTEDISNLPLGVYTVTITDSRGCNVVSAEIPVLLTAIGEQSTEVVSLFPNPFHSAITIRVKENETEGILKIYSLNGQLLLTIQPEAGKQIIDTAHWPAGICVAEWTSALGIQRFRLIRE